MANDNDLIADYLANNEVTKCPPVSGLGVGAMSTQLKDTVREARAAWKQETGLRLTAAT